MDIAELYQNPLIEPGTYFGRVEDVELTADTPRPLIQIRIRISDLHDESGTTIYSVIHPTSKADGLYEAFCQALLIYEGNLTKAKDKYLRFEITHDRYGETEYSRVIYLPQRTGDILKAKEARIADQSVEKAKEMKEKQKAEKERLRQRDRETYRLIHGHDRGRGRPRKSRGVGPEMLFD